MDDFQPLRDLEARRVGEPFTYLHDGIARPTFDPRDVDFETLLHILRERDLPGLPNMRVWKLVVLFERWAAHWDLPEFSQAQRLAYVVNRYRDALEHDLHVHSRVDLADLWRARRWRFLLNMIDHLPRHCYYSEAVSNDPEHAKMIAEAIASRTDANSEAEAAVGPPLHTWTPEVAALTDLTDAVRRVEYAVVAVQAEKGKGPKPPEPMPRPQSAGDKARRIGEYERRKKKHDKLAARLLPHKRPPEAE